MPLPGGPSDKAGNRYEYLWTVRCMMRVLRSEADSIHLEPAGDEGKGIEFTVYSSSRPEHHQVKRQLTGEGVWSLSELDSRGVLSNFYQKLQDPNSSCVFTSSHAAHPLDELEQRAKDSSSWEDFEGKFISSNGWAHNFSQLHDRWDSSSKEDTYNRLKRVNVTTIDEDELRESIESGLEALVAGNPSNILSVLLDFASIQVHQVLTAAKIWGFLRSREFARQQWSHEQSVADSISELNQTYLSGIQPVGIGGEVVPRAEVDLILDSFDDPSARTVMVSGRAGVGKTAVISQTLQRIQDRDWPMLALRVDRLEPSPTPSELGSSLGLPASPVSVLAAIADGRDCLLVIDQVDAVSHASGRNPEFFDCISALLHQALAYDNIKVLSACRKFDIDNDLRIRDLTKEGGIAKEIPVEQFGKETVRTLTEKLGIDPKTLSPKQVDLLRLPIHLKLLEEALSDGDGNATGFQTPKDLFDRFWSYKLKVIHRRVDPSRVEGVLDRIVKTMTERQALSVAAGLLDEYEDAVSVMVSENVLDRDGQRISFFHESFFDYIFARRMISSPGFDLVAYILDQGQSLFIRSQVRQVLLHLRDISTQDCSRDLEAVLTDMEIRPHIKAIVLSLLGTFDDPAEEEWEVVEPLLETNLASHVWTALHGSTGWFDLLDGLGVVNRWLESGDETAINRVLWLLTSVQKDRPDRTAELLSPFAGSSELWNDRIAGLFIRSDIAASRGFFDFVLALINAGAVDGMLYPGREGDYFWLPIETVVQGHPEWICELIAAYLGRLLSVASQTGNTKEFPLKLKWDRTGEKVIDEAANAAPKTFVELLLPLITNTLETYADRSHGPPWRDKVWGHGAIALKDGLDNRLLAGLGSSLCWMAVNNPDQFREYATTLRESEFATLQNLLLRSYAAGNEVFADEAIEYLLEDAERRFSIGYVSTSSVDAVEQLVGVVTPFCSSANFGGLEQVILDYYPEWERRTDNRQSWGVSQLRLLRNMEPSRLSERGTRRLQELSRKFEDAGPLERRGPEGGRVRSPIPESSAGKMNDDEWLGAMKRYSSDLPNYEPGKFLVGSAHELSQLLEAQTHEDPLRFANLVHRIPDESNSSYFEAILRGLVGADIEMEAIVQACLRCHRIPGHPLGRWVTRPLVHSAGSQLPDDALEMVAWYATKHLDPDPVTVSSDVTYYQGGQENQRYDPIMVGINSVRGSAAGSIARLLAPDDRYLAFFEPHLKLMVKDLSDATRACVAEALLEVLRHRRDLAVELFVELCDADERLLATHHFEDFLKYAIPTHFTQLESILVRMMESEDEAVATSGALWGCYASLTVEEALPLAIQCSSGSKPQRLGAAKVYAANLKLSAHRFGSEKILVTLFSDPEKEVRHQAARCFYGFEGRGLWEYESLVAEYIQSPAFEPGHNPLFDALEKTTANMSDIALMACERVFELAAEKTGDISTAVARTSGDMAKLIVRVYSRTTDPSFRTRCLDIIDKMSLFGAHGLEAITEEFDR